MTAVMIDNDLAGAPFWRELKRLPDAAGRAVAMPMAAWVAKRVDWAEEPRFAAACSGILSFAMRSYLCEAFPKLAEWVRGFLQLSLPIDRGVE